LPAGGGLSLHGGGSGVELEYQRGPFTGGLGYEYGGGFTAEGGIKTPLGPASLGLGFDPWKKEGTAGLRLGDFWLNGQYGEKGWGLGAGYGFPFITPPGFPTNPGDPSKDWREGEIGPGIFGPPGDIQKYGDKSWGIGGGVSVDQEGHPTVWGGIGGYF
jgi:hypothetical protein